MDGKSFYFLTECLQPRDRFGADIALVQQLPLLLLLLGRRTLPGTVSFVCVHSLESRSSPAFAVIYFGASVSAIFKPSYLHAARSRGEKGASLSGPNEG